MQTWRMFCHDCKDHKGGQYFAHFGAKRWVELHGLRDPIVEVELTENPDGQYYGWLRTNSTEPTMIQPHRSLFEICFPYGSKAGVDAGQGTVLRFDVKKVA